MIMIHLIYQTAYHVFSYIYFILFYVPFFNFSFCYATIKILYNNFDCIVITKNKININ